MYFDGKPVQQMKSQQLRRMRQEMQIIFQDPFGSLNPRFHIRDIIGEPLRVHQKASAKEIDKRVVELMELVGLDASRRNRYPHEFSGGQRQRIGIARAIALHPRFIVADEAVSALDVSVQSQVLNLLMKLQQELGLTFLFIAHGLNVVRHISDRIGVMYLGKLVEVALTEELFANPMHPYTAALLSAIPRPTPHRKAERIVLQGMCRRRPIRHPAAASTRAALMRRPSAGIYRLSFRRLRPAGRWPAISRSIMRSRL